MAAGEGERREGGDRAGDPMADVDALVDAGRRAPGSDGERRAAGHLQRRLAGLGRAAASEPVDVWPNWPLAYAVCAALTVAGSVLAVSLPGPAAALALAGALLTFLDAGLLLPIVRRLFGRRASQNVVSWGDRARPGLLILVAHYDAGRGGLASSAAARERKAAVGRLVRRPIGALEPLFWAQLAVLACCLLRLLDVSGVVLTAVQFVPTAALIVAMALLIDIALSGTRGGENDNASGVALALRLTERFGSGRLEHFDLHVLLSGGQTAVAAGMRGFLKRHRGDLGPERTVVVNLDEVGCGTVRYTRREGPLSTAPSHRRLVGLCDAIAEDDADEGAFGARPLVNRAATDAYAARSAGLPALTITCRDPIDHAPGRVEEESIERAEAFCAELIRRLDAEVGPDLAGPLEETVLSAEQD
jgi:hypothetical protein